MAGIPLIPSSLRTDPEGDEDVGSWWVSFTVCHVTVTTNSVLLTLFFVMVLSFYDSDSFYELMIAIYGLSNVILLV